METGGLVLSRRKLTGLCAGFGASLIASNCLQRAWAQSTASEKPLLARAIPHSGEMLPVIGLGTIIVFDVGGDAAKRMSCSNTVRALVAHGGSLIDTAESYGTAEGVLGDILADTGLRSRVFLATKFDIKDYSRANGPTAFQGSLKQLRTPKLDLMQFHNVRDPNQDLGLLRDWKAQGLCRYTGITTTSEDSYDATVAILEREKPDFLMVDYAIDKRAAEARVLPAAASVGTAVVVALPFGRGRVFHNVLSKPLPDWVAEFDCASWAQFFLKFTLGNPAVTVVAPGTDKTEHMIDNLGGGRGRLPDEAMRARMAKFIEAA
jgi:aryl-alcohol dehydrogenase-like predicted oxidoreductase